jgi:uncharacterized OB-fold protein
MTSLVRPEPRRDVYETPFWQFVDGGHVHLQRCNDCHAYRYPPSGVCSHCLSQRYQWEPISGHGSVLSWVKIHRQYFPGLPVPYTVVAGETPEGPILIANLVDADDELLRLGMELRLCYETAVTEAGQPWQIYQWSLEVEP